MLAPRSPSPSSSRCSPARPAHAQEDDQPPETTEQAEGADLELAIFGTLSYEDSESAEEVPAGGVTIEVDGVGTVVTDDEGKFRIVVPAAGNYDVALDVETLPEGVNLRNPDNNPLSATVSVDREQRVIFPLVFGEAAGDTTGQITVRRVAQLTLEGLKLGLYLAMAAIGMSLIFGTTGLANFAHAEIMTWGMLTTYLFNFFGMAGLFGFLASCHRRSVGE